MACTNMEEGVAWDLCWVPSFLWMCIRHRMTRTERYGKPMARLGTPQPTRQGQARLPFPALPNLKRKVIVRNTVDRWHTRSHSR